MLPAEPLDAATAHHPMRVRREHYLQEERRRIRGGTSRVVPKPLVERRQIHGVLHQVVNRMLEGAGEELPREVDGEQLGLRVDLLVAGHGSLRRGLLLYAPPSSRFPPYPPPGTWLHRRHSGCVAPSGVPRSPRTFPTTSLGGGTNGQTVRECFVIMPIGSGDAYQAYRNRYERIIKPAVEGLRVDDQQVFRCVRADFVTTTGSITRDLLRRLYRSDAVVADLTDLNPNVFYELGVRHALRSGTILIALKGTRLPFDVGDLRVIPYEDRVGGEDEAIPQIQDMLKSLLGEERQQDSPVLHAIPELAELGAAKEHEARIAALQRERDLLRAQLEVSEKTGLTNQASLEAMRTAIEELSKRLSGPQRRDAQEEIESLVHAKRAVPSPIRLPRMGEVAVDPDTVFVLMPMSGELEPIYEVIRHAADEAGLRSYRADSISATASIIDQIFESIAKSGLIVADLTGRNQNVMYELGLANAMGKRTLLLSQDVQDVPFDVRHQDVLIYSLSFSRVEDLRRQLIEAFRRYKVEGEYYSLEQRLASRGIHPAPPLMVPDLRSRLRGHLVLGNVVVDGALGGFGGVHSKQIIVTMTDDLEPRLPASVREAKHRLKEPVPNRPKVFFVGWEPPIIDTGNILKLSLCKSDYWTSLAVEEVTDQLHDEIRTGTHALEALPKRLDLVIALVTADLKLILCRRAGPKQIRYYPETWSVIGETMDAEDDKNESGELRPEMTVLRALTEFDELHLPPEVVQDAQVRFVALTTIWQYLLANLNVFVKLRTKDLKFVQDCWTPGECTALDGIPFTPDSCLQLITAGYHQPLGRPELGAALNEFSRFSILAALFSEFGYHRVMAEI